MIGAPAPGLRLTDAQKLNWLRLLRSDNVGPATFRDLVNGFGSAEAALEALPELARRGGGRRIVLFPKDRAEAEFDAIHRHGARLVALGEDGYPEMLSHMDMPPPLVTVRGSGQAFRQPTIAIVGARNASIAGARMARMIAGELGSEGIAIASGLARGIDTAAHGASLASGTIAVLAGGIDRPYPPENQKLCEEIAEKGALVSEMPFGWEPRARDFPRRNRLIAGLAIGLVVVEAAARSGSLISARLAGEMGRLVFAVPGSPLDPRAYGTNRLLKDGASLVTMAADILDEIAPYLRGEALGGTALREAPAETDESDPAMALDAPVAEDDRSIVVGALGPTPSTIDDIIRHTALGPPVIATILLELDLAGRLERHSGGAVSLVAGPL